MGFWKSYFWNYGALTLAGILFELVHPGQAPGRLLIGFVFTPIAMVALFGRAYYRDILPQKAWRTLLFAAVTWETFALAVGMSPTSAMIADTGVRADGPTAGFIPLMTQVIVPIAVVLSALPPMIALYHNAYPKAPS